MLDQSLDNVFHALSDASRRRMVERLVRSPASVSDLAKPLDMTLAAVVQHVQVLETCGVIKTEKQGRTRMCRVEPKALTAAQKWIQERRDLWERRLDSLEEELRKNK